MGSLFGGAQDEGGEEGVQSLGLNKDAVAEIRLLEKYKGLAFYDPVEKITYTIVDKNLGWYKSSKRKGIDGGWYIVATSDEDEVESFMIEDELCVQIADTPQEDGIEIV